MTIRVGDPARYATTVKAAAAGVTAIHLAATIQAFSVLSTGLMEGRSATIYLLGLLIGVMLSLATSFALLLILAARSRTAFALGLGLLSAPIATWADQWVIGVFGPMDLPLWLPFITRWLPAILVGCALAWFGLRSARDSAVWYFSAYRHRDTPVNHSPRWRFSTRADSARP